MIELAATIAVLLVIERKRRAADRARTRMFKGSL